jgi:hypothetical protein
MAVAPTPVPHGRPVVRVVAVVAALVAAAILLGIAKDVFSRSSESGAVQGSGVPAAQTRDVPPFDRVELAGSNNVMIRVGGEQSVVVHADDNLVERVTTHVYGGNLVIGNVEGGFTTRTPMRVEVTVPRIDALTLSGSGAISAAGIDSKALTVTLPGSGVVTASGRTDAVRATLGGSGAAQLQELVAQDVHAVVNGSGQILVTATHLLDASVPGSGSVFYRGDPQHVRTTITGTGTVTRG